MFSSAIYSALILVCLTGETPNNANCEVIPSPFKYTSEEHCWQAISLKAHHWLEKPDFGEVGEYYPAGAHCIKWLEEGITL